MWPTGYLPSWSAPTGGTDKPGMPTEKRRLANDPPLEMLTSKTRRLWGRPPAPLRSTPIHCLPPCARNTTTSARCSTGLLRTAASETAAVLLLSGPPLKGDTWGWVVSSALRAWRRARESTHSHSNGSRYRNNRFQQCTGSATLGAVNNVAKFSLYCVQDDYRWWSRIFGLHQSEFPNSPQYATFLIDGRYASASSSG